MNMDITQIAAALTGFLLLALTAMLGYHYGRSVGRIVRRAFRR